jgi:hypothetical protein
LSDFAVTLLAVCFFRLPALQPSIIEAVTPSFSLQSLYKRNLTQSDTDIKWTGGEDGAGYVRMSRAHAHKMTLKFKQQLVADLESWMNTERISVSYTTPALRTFRQNNPSLFGWQYFKDATVDEHFATYSAPLLQAIRRKLQEPAFFFDFLRSYVSHIHSISYGEVNWSAIPGYLPMAHNFIKRMLVRFYVSVSRLCGSRLVD